MDKARVLVAPDSFKGTFDAMTVAGALGRGLSRAGVQADLCPVADGGEGTAAILATATGGTTLTANTTDPSGEAIAASFVMLSDGRTAVIDVAAASGLTLVPAEQRDAVHASSYGTGQLVVAALAAGARRVLVAAGGSATTDGGAGVIEAIRDGGGIHGAELVVLTDVRTPFEQAATVFGPQKGASPADVCELTGRLARLAVTLPRDPRGIPGTGAAGGLAGGLWAAFDASIVAGAAYVLDTVRFNQRLTGADAVVTGEGRFDAQSLEGKITGEVLLRAATTRMPCRVIAGSADPRTFSGHHEQVGARLIDLVEASTLAEIEAAGYEYGRRVGDQKPRAMRT